MICPYYIGNVKVYQGTVKIRISYPIDKGFNMCFCIQFILV